MKTSPYFAWDPGFFFHFLFSFFPGVYIMENTPPPRGEKYQPMSFGGKNMKKPREKGQKCGRKGKKGERKRKNGERKLEKRKQKGKLNAK
jgi:hypothetical protein